MPLSRRSFDNNNTGNTGARGKPHKRGLTPKRKSTPTWREREAAFAMEEEMQRLVVDGGSGGGWIGDVSDLGMDAAMLLPWGRGIKSAGKVGKALGKFLGIGGKATTKAAPKVAGKIMGSGAELPLRRIRPKITADDLVAAKKADPTGYLNSRAWQTPASAAKGREAKRQMKKFEEALETNPELRRLMDSAFKPTPTFSNPLAGGPKALKAGSAGQRSRTLPMQAEKMSGNRFGSRWDTADDLADRLAGTALPRDAGARRAASFGGNAATDPLYNLRWAVFDDMLAGGQPSKRAADWVKRADFDMLQQYLGR